MFPTADLKDSGKRKICTTILFKKVSDRHRRAEHINYQKISYIICREHFCKKITWFIATSLRLWRFVWSTGIPTQHIPHSSSKAKCYSFTCNSRQAWDARESSVFENALVDLFLWGLYSWAGLLDTWRVSWYTTARAEDMYKFTIYIRYPYAWLFFPVFIIIYTFYGHNFVSSSSSSALFKHIAEGGEHDHIFFTVSVKETNNVVGTENKTIYNSHILSTWQTDLYLQDFTRASCSTERLYE